MDPNAKGAAAVKLRPSLSQAMEHEMYSSLGAVLGMLEVLSISVEQPLSPPQKKLVDEALRFGDGLRARLEALLVMFSDADGASQAPCAFTVRRLVDHAVRAASWSAHEKRVTLRLPEHGAWESEAVVIDVARVDRALRGMTDAVIAAVPEGGAVHLRVEVLPEQVRLSLLAEGDGVQGDGPELAHSHVLHAGWTHLIALQGGRLSIDSRPARIVLDLPRSAVEAP